MGVGLGVGVGTGVGVDVGLEEGLGEGEWFVPACVSYSDSGEGRGGLLLPDGFSPDDLSGSLSPVPSEEVPLPGVGSKVSQPKPGKYTSVQAWALSPVT